MMTSIWGPDSTNANIQTSPPPSGSWKPVKVLIGILVVLALLVGAGAYYFFVYRAPQASAITITGSVPGQIFGGEPFDMTLSVSNTSANGVENATLTLLLPEGIDATGPGAAGARTVSIPIGSLASAVTLTKSVTLVGHGDQNAVRQVNATVQYTTPNAPDKTLQTSQDIIVSLGPPAMQLTLDGPQYVALGKNFTVTVHYKNNLSHSLATTSLQLQYPPTYTFASSTPAPVKGTNRWDLPPLASNEEGNIAVDGTVAPGRSDTFPFIATIGATASSTYTIVQQSLTTQLLPDPLQVTVLADNKQDAVAHIGDTIQYDIMVKNLTSFPLQNVIVASKLLSPLFDRSSVTSQGSFSSVNDTVTWNVASTPDLRTLAPNAEVRVSFAVRLAQQFPIHSASDKNLTALIATMADSPTVPPDTALTRVSGAATTTVKLAGNLQFASQAYWKEPSAGIVNKGPFPPRVNQPTQYTIHWVLRTQGTDLKNVHLSASLQSGAKWTGVVKGNMPTMPAYNANSGEVTWDIPLLPANRGSVGIAPAEAVFQVSLTPATNQVGRAITFLSQTNLSGTDNFTNDKVTARAESLTTDLPDDKAAPHPGSVVQ